jgi:hypothetical protein
MDEDKISNAPFFDEIFQIHITTSPFLHLCVVLLHFTLLMREYDHVYIFRGLIPSMSETWDFILAKIYQIGTQYRTKKGPGETVKEKAKILNDNTGNGALVAALVAV